MVARAYGKALSDHEIEDIYSAAWTATLAALRTRGAGMTDEELRSYVLTAVATHASKELRRRSRKPSGCLDSATEHSMADHHQPLPEELAIGSESAGIARDLLSSLPARRRAVMLMRYGWGLSPAEVCGLVNGLSSRAYRKEVTRGVEQLIERLKQVESGEWCESREAMLRDFVAGTADEDTERQVKEHLEHCRSCSTFAASLTHHLHEFGGLAAVALMAGTAGAGKVALLDRAAGLLHATKERASDVADTGGSTLSSIAASGGARGSGAAGAGIVAKVAGLGGAGKAVLACIGAGAAASACVAAGVVPGISLSDLDLSTRPDREAAIDRKVDVRPAEPTQKRPATLISPIADAPQEPAAPAEWPTAPESLDPKPAGDPDDHGSDDQKQPDPPPDPPAPAAAEFDPVAMGTPVAPAATAAPAPSGGSGGGGSGSSSGGSSGGGSSSPAAGNEFGP